MLDDAAGRLSAKGTLIVEIGDGQKAHVASRPDLPFLWLETETSKGEVFALFANALKEANAESPSAVRRPRGRSGI